jgi:hypothetical protein
MIKITINSEEEVEDVGRSLRPVLEWRGGEKWSRRRLVEYKRFKGKLTEKGGRIGE